MKQKINMKQKTKQVSYLESREKVNKLMKEFIKQISNN